jgi:endonuclease/exonuclease/phosphatase family metal-dependent hydrolase
VGVNYRGREAQAAALVERMEGLDGPAVLMGDFNMDERADAHDVFAGALRDAYEEVGPGFGFTWPSGWRYRGVPVPGPLVRLDYVFHTPDLRAEDAYRVCEGATDHCYVVARLGWR